MNFTRQSAAAALLTACFAAGLAASGASAFAAEAPDAPGQGTAQHGPEMPVRDGGGPADSPRHGFGGPGPGAPGPGMPFHEGPSGGLPPLHGLKLSEAQQDKLFAITYAEAPQRRDHEKAIRKADDTLHELGHADRFDDARASAAARDLGQAITAQTLLRARTEAKILAVLTPEQRAELRQRREHGHGPMGPRDDGRGRQDGPQDPSQHGSGSGAKGT